MVAVPPAAPWRGNFMYMRLSCAAGVRYQLRKLLFFVRILEKNKHHQILAGFLTRQSRPTNKERDALHQTPQHQWPQQLWVVRMDEFEVCIKMIFFAWCSITRHV